MNQDKYVFAQLVEFLNNDKFRRLVDKYDGNRYVKHFTCWSQLLAMMFGQLSNRESLRDLIVALEAHQGKRYHLGLGREPIAKTTLASANQNRDYRIFEDFAFYMMKEACEKRSTHILDIPVRKYAFDSTTIPLCLAIFPWAKFRKKKGACYAPGVFPFLIFVIIAMFFNTTANALLTIGLSGLGGSIVAIPLHYKYLQSKKPPEEDPQLTVLKDIANKLSNLDNTNKQ